MALLESGRPLRDVLPPINHPDFEKSRSEKNESSRFTMSQSLSVATAPLGSPTSTYPGPPPPYSCVSSGTEPVHNSTGYFSPIQPTRRSTRDEKDFATSRTLPSLPSLHEALGADKSATFSGPPSATPSHGPASTSSTTIGPSFPDGPRGPPNPFSYSGGLPPPPATVSTPAQSDPVPPRPINTTNFASDTSNWPPTQLYSSSPRTGTSSHRFSGGSFSSVSRPQESSAATSPYSIEPSVQNNLYKDHNAHPSSLQPSSSTFSFEPSAKFDDSRNPFTRSNNNNNNNNTSIPYGETVKRHLDAFDVELALNEINDANSVTFNSARTWTQRYHQGNRLSSFLDNAPSIQEVDDVLKQYHRAIDQVTRMREVVVMQQTALSEQRARAARGHPEDEYHGMHDDYRPGGFAGGDAKKRRGKAAPPGRCHSCNRAETPEWRRGPDGARTLCNACGLHYAKLTRKLGANKASALTGSHLRPKGLDPRPTHN